MHDVLTIAVPLIAILFGILLNRQGLNDLRHDLKAEMRATEERLSARIGVLERGYRDLYKVQSQLETRVDSLHKNSDERQALQAR